MHPDYQKISQHLRQLPLSSLDKSIPGIYEFLIAMDESPTTEILVEAIIIIKGTSIFNDTDLRNQILENNGLKGIRTWSRNRECSEALKNLGLSDDYLPMKREVREAHTDLSVDPKLHEYQDWMKRKVSQFILSGTREKLMVQMPTGSGKTWTMMESIYDFLRIKSNPDSGIVWVAHTDELCEQAVESFARGWGKRGTFDIEILRLWGGNVSRIDKIPESSFFAVTSFQSANSMISSKRDDIFHLLSELKARNSLLIVDEAHQAKAPTYETAINFIKPYQTPVIGLSATPGRDSIDSSGEETRQLAQLFDGNLYSIEKFCSDRNKTPIRYLQDQGVLSSITYTQLKTDYSIELNQNELESFKQTLRLPDSFLRRVGEDVARNTLIISQVIRLVEDEQKKPLVFAPSKDNSDFLASLLVQRGIKAKSVTGETKFTDRKNAVKDFKNGDIDVLLNYGVFTTGFDDPKINCVIIARPTTSIVLYSQMIGRGLRGPKNGGTKNCLVVDVIDNIDQQPDIDLANNYFDQYWS